MHATPLAAWNATSQQVSELCKRLRKELGEVEYLRVTEIHDGKTKKPECQRTNGDAVGYPHYHALLRSGYIAQKRLSDLWGELTGAPVVWIAKIADSFSSFRYLVKYLTKLHKIEWTDRHVSYSRGFFRQEDLEKIAYPERQVEQRSDEHPWLYLSKRYRACEIGCDHTGAYHLPFRFSGRPEEVTRQDVGLPPLPENGEPTNEQIATDQSAATTRSQAVLFQQPAASYYDTDF